MQTDCSADLFGFARVEGRAVVARFDGGKIASDAGALLLGATDRAIRLVDRFAECFADSRAPELIEHTVGTLVGQRVFALALGYEDLVDHDELRHDPPWRCWPASCRPAARIARRWPTNRRSTGWSGAARSGRAITASPVRGQRSRRCLSICSWEVYQRSPEQIILDLDATDHPLHRHQEGRFFHGYYCHLRVEGKLKQNWGAGRDAMNCRVFPAAPNRRPLSPSALCALKLSRKSPASRTATQTPCR
jgi:hypothetical protein